MNNVVCVCVCDVSSVVYSVCCIVVCGVAPGGENAVSPAAWQQLAVLGRGQAACGVSDHFCGEPSPGPGHLASPLHCGIYAGTSGHLKFLS